MKKFITVVLALTFVLSLSVTSFGAVSITHSFRAADENGEEFIYHFGTFEPSTDKEVGLLVGNNEYKLDDEAYTAAVKAGGETGKGLFGIGLIDKNNVYGGEYTVTPYTKTEIGGERTESNPIAVVESEMPQPEDKIVYDEPVLTLSGFGSLAIDDNGAYSTTTTTTGTINKNGSPALRLEAKKASYLTFDISKLKGINEDKLITISFTNYRHGANDGQFIYMYGMTDESKYETINENVIVNKYNIAYDSSYNNGVGNQANDPMTATFNITNYIKNKMLNGETTVTFVFVLKSQTVQQGYLAYQGEDIPELNYVSKLTYEGSDKNEEFVPFYVERDIPFVKAGNIAIKTGEILQTTLWKSGNPIFITSYDSNFKSGSVTRNDDNAFVDFDISNIKGINEGRRIILEYGVRRRAPQSATGIYIDIFGAIESETLMIDENIHFDTVASGTTVVKKQADITNYIKSLIAKNIKTSRIIFTVENTDDTEENPNTETYIAIALGNAISGDDATFENCDNSLISIKFADAE